MSTPAERIQQLDGPPAHWTSVPLKYALKNVVEKAEGDPMPFVALEHIASGTGALIRGFEWAEAPPEQYARFRPGDILFGKLRPYLRKFLLTDRNGCCPTELLVLRPQPSLDSGFGYYLVQSDNVISYAHASSYGVKMPRTSWGQLGRLGVQLPPLPQQRAISAFLDRETARIDELVARRQAWLALLEERQQTLVSLALLGCENSELAGRGHLEYGFNASGDPISYLRAVTPRHWSVEPLGRSVLSKTDGPFGSRLTSAHYVDTGARVIRLGNIGRARFMDKDRAYIALQYFQELRQYEVCAGDLLVAALGDENHPLGRSCVAPNDLGPTIVKADCFRLRLDPARFKVKYIAFFLSSSVGTALAGLYSRGATRSRMNLSDVAMIRVPRPPLEEQCDILALIERRMVSLERLREVALRSILQYQERRQTLITAAVTGRIHVA